MEIFPQLMNEQLKYVYSLPTCNKFDLSMTCLMEGPTLEALRSLTVMQLVIPLNESLLMQMMKWLALHCHTIIKHDRFNKAAYVRISMKH